MQMPHLPQTNPELHTQLQALLRERSSEGGGLLPAGSLAGEAQDGVANNMQAQSDYLRDMVVRRPLYCLYAHSSRAHQRM